MTLVLQTERLTLRRPDPRDETAVIDFFASPRAEFVGGSTDRVAAARKWLEVMGHWSLRDYGLWAVTPKGSDDIIGLVGPYNQPHWPEPELGWLMFAGAEGKGLGHEAAFVARADVQDRLGWTDFVSYIAPANARSIRLAERLGATHDPQAKVPNPAKPCLVYRHPTAMAG